MLVGRLVSVKIDICKRSVCVLGGGGGGGGGGRRMGGDGGRKKRRKGRTLGEENGRGNGSRRTF